MHDSAMWRLRSTLESLAPLPAAEWDAFAKTVRPSKLETGASFLQFRGPSKRVGFVASGLLKAYYRARSGDEYIRAFLTEGEFAAALSALYQGSETPSEVEIIALEPTELLVFDYEAVRSRLSLHWTWQQIGRLIAERYYVLRERRQFELMTMLAEERLKSFFVQYPGLANRISQKDLAAYVGITPVSLSRLRAKEAKARQRDKGEE